MSRICCRFNAAVSAAIAGLLVAALASTVSAQSGISACINPAGQVRLLRGDGDSCGPQEQYVTWSVQGPQGPAGPKGEPGAAGPVVVDAAGARVGWYASPLIIMNVDDQWFSVYALRDGFSSPSLGMTFAYLTPDCTGQRYGSGAGGGLVPNAQVLSQHAWYADLDALAVTITGTAEAPGVFWFEQSGPGGPVWPCSANAVIGTTVLYPMRSVDVSGFVPPFRLTN